MNDDYANLASRYRPRNFGQVVGQVHVVEILRRAVLAGRVPQQLLFSGGSGLGKTTIARIVAAAMLCETAFDDRDRGDACGSCSSCTAVWSGRHPDLIEFDAASHGGKDEVRDIAARAQVLPLRAAVKVYIIDEAHGLSNPGGQAFLKLLEEPPAHVRFMLCTTDPQRMLKTNRGRCVEFELLPPGHSELLANLRRIATAEGWRASDEIFNAVLNAADPDLGVRGTVTAFAKLGPVLLDPQPPSAEMVAALLGTPSPVLLRELVDAIVRGDRSGALRSLVRARTTSPDMVLLDALIDWARQGVIDALTGSETDVDRALDRLETLLASSPSPGHLDVAVARLAERSRTAPPSPEQSPEVATTPAPAPAPVPPAPATPPAPQPAEPAARRSGLSEDAARLLAAATPVPTELRSLLERCEVLVTADAVDLVVPERLVQPMSPHVPLLRTAAGRLGLPLRLRKPPPSPGP